MPMRNADARDIVPPACGPADARVVEILGVRITNLHTIEAVAHMQKLIWVAASRARAAYIVNAHTLNLTCDDPEYRTVLNDADVVFGDGTGVRWAARWQGKKMIANLVGTDLLPFFFVNTMERAYRYFLVGARTDVVARAAANLPTRFPGLNVVGYHHGHYPPAEHDAVVARINAARPDVLMVAMGNPIQERWIHDNRERLTGVKLAVGVGGLFDHWGGVLTRAPKWVRRHGFEWVQLMMQQPHKWRRYLIGNPKFLARVARDEWRRP
ncbi:MAG: WecB/TagA/CpsF family glycosyltransferase [Deltaproteobacteria bacterium]|nr:WecB/TagA/CpsF family glycosyltransferase [Deltaproteobacteria bacterium]